MTSQIYHKCPKCGEMLKVTGELTDGSQSVISPGDFTVCPKCAVPLLFNDLGLFQVTHPQIVELQLAGSPKELRAFRQLREDILKKLT